MSKSLNKSYISFIAELKQSIIKSRYQAARLANREQLLLYLYVGKRLSEKIETEKWGANVLENIANDLQQELPGLRGFSGRNLRNMRQFSDEYISLLIWQLPTAKSQNTIWQLLTAKFGQSSTARLKTKKLLSSTAGIRPSGTVQLKKSGKQSGLPEEQMNAFFGISFTHHITLLNKCKNLSERLFYMQLTSDEMLSVSILEHHIKARTYKKLGKLPNNFKAVMSATMRATALNVFKDQYLFDFMSLDDTEDERVFEDAIVANIRKFIMSLGKGFSFIGNQYRMELGIKEYFTDLLFYNRMLQCLVVFELKRGKFKPEYAGKLNFYLNILDDKIKLAHEKPSIGIILCKEKDYTVVEYSFKGISKAMGVATYKLRKEVPKAMKGILPDAAALRKLLK